MKKIRIILPVILSIVSLTVGCTSHKNSGIDDKGSSDNGSNELYRVFVYDYSDSASSAEHKPEIEYTFADYEKYKDAAVDDNKEISVNGTTYSGKYKESQYREYNYFPVHRYVDEKGISFEVDESGMLTSCFLGNASLQGTKKTKDECVAAARDFLAGIVAVDCYDIDVVEDSERGMYTVNFIKKLGDYQTTDAATIVVKNDGNLYSYSSFMLGKVTEKSISTDTVNLDKVKASVSKKLSSVYQDAENHYSKVEYSEPGMALTVLRDGGLGVVCTVNARFIEEAGEFETSVSESVCFVVVVD